MTNRTDWSSIGRISVISSLTLAVVLFFALPDDRWIAAVLVGMSILDAFIYALVLPRLTGGGTGGAPSLDELEKMNAEAEWPTSGEAPAPDDEWGKRQPGDV
ncbi:MAG: hypothetical protein QOI31_2132 [Solirubrobacterales bacterium]|jgi:hypothetical protein|nr:hypothetical protein [Solirubrobacterales bacterium]